MIFFKRKGSLEQLQEFTKHTLKKLLMSLLK